MFTENEASGAVIYLKDYVPSPFLIDFTDINVIVGRTHTVTESTLHVRRNNAVAATQTLALDGTFMTLEELRINDIAVPLSAVEKDDEHLYVTLPHDIVDEDFTIFTRVYFSPEDNKTLQGLYFSDNVFCTQCEPEGMRRIIYCIDRPDVLSKYRVRIVADRSFKYLLANGNLIEEGVLNDDQHFAVWEDPFPKPSYLFAMVVGNFVCLEDKRVTKSGREVTLQIYAQDVDAKDCSHAMASLKKAMQWDEDTFGLEYDLDRYMIVAVRSFNMGAMENKGLNIFNDRFILANKAHATDVDYELIESCVGHEYFHNWTGNRVTCRDWFQLCLKEGLTVFREQIFVRDVRSCVLSLLDAVYVLYTRQFPEDQSPLAHPVRPFSFIKINNFYTATVYEKGAQLVHMIEHLIGEEAFRKGLQRYLENNDGRAATVEDFLQAFEGPLFDMLQFRMWYEQEGTPLVRVERHYDAAARTYTLTVRQSFLNAGKRRVHGPALPIPLCVALIDAKGDVIPLSANRILDKKAHIQEENSCLLYCDKKEQTFTFKDIEAEPTPALLRGFSAPVKVESDLTLEESAHLMRYESDPFIVWQESHRLFLACIQESYALLEQQEEGGTPTTAAGLEEKMYMLERGLSGLASRDHTLASYMLTVPSYSTILESMEGALDPLRLHEAQQNVRRGLAQRFKKELKEIYADLVRVDQPYEPSPEQSARRRLLLSALSFLATDSAEGVDYLVSHYKHAQNMTERFGALRLLAEYLDASDVQKIFKNFYEEFKETHLVVIKWMAAQALAPLTSTLEHVRALRQHSAFDILNPNKVYALFGSMAHRNPVAFHARSGEGYKMIGETIREIDPENPLLASSLVPSFQSIERLQNAYKDRMRGVLAEILAVPTLSQETHELTEKILNDSNT